MGRICSVRSLTVFFSGAITPPILLLTWLIWDATTAAVPSRTLVEVCVGAALSRVKDHFPWEAWEWFFRRGQEGSRWSSAHRKDLSLLRTLWYNSRTVKNQGLVTMSWNTVCSSLLVMAVSRTRAKFYIKARALETDTCRPWCLLSVHPLAWDKPLNFFYFFLLKMAGTFYNDVYKNGRWGYMKV